MTMNDPLAPAAHSVSVTVVLPVPPSERGKTPLWALKHLKETQNATEKHFGFRKVADPVEVWRQDDQFGYEEVWWAFEIGQKRRA